LGGVRVCDDGCVIACVVAMVELVVGTEAPKSQ
jgi:hypothetical protein